METPLKGLRDFNLFFLPDYIERSLKAQGVTLEDLALIRDSVYNQDNLTENLQAKLRDSLSRQDVKDIAMLNQICFGCISDSTREDYKNDFTSMPGEYVSDLNIGMLLGNDFDMLPGIMISSSDVRDFMLSLVNSHNSNSNHSLIESGVMEVKKINNVLFVLAKPGFFNLSVLQFTSFKELLVSDLLISLFRFFTEEEVYKSYIFNSMFRILNKF